jgi:glycosyltransferase involved in cell wall biosynthesis
MRDRLTAGKKDKKLLLYVGRLAPEKDIEKIREVLMKSPDFCLAIIGDGPHRVYLENYFKGTSTVFTGFLHGDELASAYASSDIFVFPSTTETLGLVLLEAMSSGLPVVAAKSGPTSEQVSHGITGMLYDPNDQDEFVNHILKLGDDTLRLKMAELAREASQKVGWDKPSEQLLDYYNRALREDFNPSKELKETTL